MRRVLVCLFQLVLCCLWALGRAESEANDTTEYDVQRLDRLKGKGKFGGIKMEAPPTSLLVTEEIWMELTIADYFGPGKAHKGKITIGCFGKVAPITCLNFVSLAKGYKKGKSLLTYNGTVVHKIIRDFMVQLGEVENKDGGGDSIFGKHFKDETFTLSHSHAGWVGMANYGVDTNGSQFYILFGPARWLDGKHVVFAKVLKGMDFLQTVGLEETDEKKVPYRKTTITGCGVVGLKKKYELTEKQFNVNGDVDL